MFISICARSNNAINRSVNESIKQSVSREADEVHRDSYQWLLYACRFCSNHKWQDIAAVSTCRRLALIFEHFFAVIGAAEKSGIDRQSFDCQSSLNYANLTDVGPSHVTLVRARDWWRSAAAVDNNSETGSDCTRTLRCGVLYRRSLTRS